MPNDSGKMADGEWLSWSCILFVLVCLLQQCSFQLIVNVRTKEGSVVQQTFNSDPVKDFVSIDFKLDEERFVTVYLDFRKKRKIFQVIVLGEIDKAESSYESMCFVTELGEGEFIPSDAMSKLRQKNPSTIRVPEEDIATDSLLTDHAVTLDTAYVTDKDINHLCKDSGQVLFRESDLKLLLPENSTRENLGNLELASEDHSSLLKQSKRCKDTPELNRECMCRVQICISWYPCQLKYCQGQDLDGQFTEYRCGIKTCGKCHNFNFFVRERRHCFWDVNSPS